MPGQGDLSIRLPTSRNVPYTSKMDQIRSLAGGGAAFNDRRSYSTVPVYNNGGRSHSRISIEYNNGRSYSCVSTDYNNGGSVSRVEEYFSDEDPYDIGWARPVID